MNNLKTDFPIFKNHPGLVYLDSAATSQKPQAVIDAVKNYYETKNANIHRGIYKLAEEATRLYEETRSLVAQFINAGKPEEIIFTQNTNYAINFVATGWAKKFLKPGDIIVLSEMEHHANIVPWLRLKEEIGIKLFFLPITKNGELNYKAPFNKSEFQSTKSETNSNNTNSNSKNVLNFETSNFDIVSNFDIRASDLKKIKLVSLTHASNVLGTINPIEEIIKYFKKQGINAKFLVDAAQSVPHMPIDVKKLGCDFLAFSAHKMLGPAGVGVLWGKEELLSEMDPMIVGSNMIRTVTRDKAIWADLPDKFEPGTANLEGVAGFGAAIKYLQKIGMQNIFEHDQDLAKYALEKLNQIPYLKLYGPQTNENRLGIFSFGINGVHPHDIAQILDTKDICVRSGHHCAQVLMQILKIPATARASLYLYNTEEDIDKLVEGIETIKKVLKI